MNPLTLMLCALSVVEGVRESAVHVQSSLGKEGRPSPV